MLFYLGANSLEFMKETPNSKQNIIFYVELLSFEFNGRDFELRLQNFGVIIARDYFRSISTVKAAKALSKGRANVDFSG